MGDTGGGMTDGMAAFINMYQVGMNVQNTGIMHRLKEGTEGTITMVGTWEVILPIIQYLYN